MDKDMYESEVDSNEGKEKNNNSKLKKEVLEWIQAIVIALVIAIVIRTYVFSLIRVNGPSMEPTLQNDDRLIVVKLFYEPKRGDVIILDPPNMSKGPYVKRIIAVSGQTVDIDFNTHKVYVDGVELKEGYIKEPTRYPGNIQFPVEVPEDSVFVLGDNRNNSKDSRTSSVGMIPYDKIEGKVTIRLWPFSSFGSIYK